MPKKTIDYSNTIIYKLYCINPDIKEFYVGHTTNLYERKRHHKTSCNNNSEKNKKYNTKVYRIIRENGGFDNWKFEILEKACLENSNQAEKLERDYIERLKPLCNFELPGQFIDNNIQKYKHENYEKNKEKVLARAKTYYEEHKEKKIEYQKNYAKENAEKITICQKEYRTKNKEKLSKKKKIYRDDPERKLKAKEANKKWREENNEKMREIITCSCGVYFQKKRYNSHIKTKTHLNYEKSISPER
jgi:hypothetical protein